MIHVLGSINIDYAVSVRELPAAGETVNGSNLLLTPVAKAQIRHWLRAVQVLKSK